MNDLVKKNCTVCRSNQSIFLFKKQNQDKAIDSISVYRCRDCNSVFLGQYNITYEAELYEYYSQDQGKPKDILFNPLTTISYHKVLDLFAMNTSGKSILDVGCGRGDFVYAGVQSGWNVNGIELSQTAVEIAQSFGLPVERLDFFSCDISPASYDIVTLFEVLEHLPNPINFIVRAAEIVKPGGLIYLTTPNFDSFDRRVLGTSWPVVQREHLTYFTPKTLLSIINKQTNLTVVSCETRNVSLESLKRIIKIFLWREKIVRESILSFPIQSTDDARKTIQASSILQLIKRGINKLLNATTQGNTIVLLLKRQG